MSKVTSLFKHAFFSLLLAFSLAACGGGGGGSLPSVDTSAPIVKSVKPFEGQRDVPSTNTISITFNEGIKDFNNSNIVIEKYIDAINTTILVDPILSLNGISYDASTNTLTFIPKSGALELKSKYRVLVRNIVDNNGNSMNDKVWDFGTITNPIGVIQPKDVLGVSLSSNISVVFTEPMDLNTLMKVNAQNPKNFILTEAGVIVPNTNILFSYDSKTNTASYILKPTTTAPNGLSKLTSYNAVLSTLVTDTNGIALATEITTDFTTGVNVGSGVKPLRPNNISVIAKNGNAVITWDVVTGSNVSYNLYATTNNGVKYVLIKEGVTGPIQANPPSPATITYSHPITSNIPYLFAVTAVEGGTESDFSLSTSEVILIPSPNQPTGQSLTISTTVAGKSTATVAWDYVSGLKYNLAVSVNGSTTFTTVQNGVVGPIIGTAPNQRIEFTHSNIKTGSSHQYRIIAENSQGSTSTPALTLAVTPIVLTPPPTGVIILSVDDASITVSWTPVPATQLPGIPITYNVYLSKDFGVTFNLLTATSITNTNFVQKVANYIPYVFAVSSVSSQTTESVLVKSVTVTPSSKGSRISSGGRHTCFIKGVSSPVIGTLWCWGANEKGQLGIGTLTHSEPPTQVGIDADWTAVAVGNSNTCGIRAGKLYCWGLNQSGALGIGSNRTTVDNKTVPTAVIHPASAQITGKWTKVSISPINFGSACAIHNETNTAGKLTNVAKLFCWGSNSGGQLGNNQISAEVLQPEPVAGIGNLTTGNNPYTDWLEVSLGYSQTCGIRKQASGSTLWCWGSRQYGQLADGLTTTETSLTAPTQELTNSTDWTSVAGGYFYTCAVSANTNSLYCWGLGKPAIGTSPVTTASDNAGDWIKVFANYNTCGIKTNGRISCWGRNYYGQSGTGTASGGSVPEIAIAKNTWQEIAIGGDHVCARESGNALSCWGSAVYHQLGKNTAETSKPTPIAFAIPGTWNDWVDIAAGDSTVLGLKGSGTTSANQLYGWGLNGSGVLGDQLMLRSLKPVASEPTNPNKWKKISTSGYNSCGILDSTNTTLNDTLWCWLSPNNNSTAPSQVGTNKWLSIKLRNTSQTFAGCGIKMDNTLWCWGNNYYGQNGNTTNIKANVNQVETIVNLPNATVSTKWQSVKMSHWNTCAITLAPENKLYCWGIGQYGAHGLGKDTSGNYLRGGGVPSAVKSPLAVAVKWKTVTVGENNACGITTANKLYCWGIKDPGVLGHSGDAAKIGVPALSSVPVAVTDARGAVEPGPWLSVSISKGNYPSACAIKMNGVNPATEGSLWCWGKNNYGQLGRNKFSACSACNATFNSVNATPKKVYIQLGQVSTWKKISSGRGYHCAIASDNTTWCWGYNKEGQAPGYSFANYAYKASPLPLVIP